MDARDVTPGVTRLTQADEVGNSKKSVENYARGAFGDWPNEAGVSTFTFYLGLLHVMSGVAHGVNFSRRTNL
jgi:hypothetical protein